MILEERLKRQILSLYNDEGIERGGFVTADCVVECENEHVNKLENFRFKCEDLDRLEEENALALFHTHPNGTSSMSKEDYYAFINWPHFLHLIVGKDGISCYKVTEKETVIMEEIISHED